MASNLSYTKRSRAKRGLPRPCKACGQDFRPKNGKAKYCSSACKQARHRQKAQEPEIVTQATQVARVTIRSKSPNNINGVSGHFRKPRVMASGWHVEAGELVFTAMPDTVPFSTEECRRFGRGHLHLALDHMADLDLDIGEITPRNLARSSARTAVIS